MMRTLLLLTAISSSIYLTACSGTPSVQSANNANTPAGVGKNGSRPVSVHEVPGSAPGGAPGGAPGQPSGGPQFGTPIDTTKLDAAIEQADKAHTAKPADAHATKVLADAYFARAEALKDAQQYRSALGDYRRTLKFDPTNEDARSMRDQIISIMESMHREVPAEGQEPPPMHKQ